MKKLLVFIFICLMMISLFKINPKASGITRTGHSDIVEMDFVDTTRGYLLLNQMSSATIKNSYNKVQRCAFGWSAYAINEEIPIWYISEVILSKSNQTRDILTYKYTLKYSTTTEKEVSITGSLAGKINGKIKGITAALEMSIRADLKASIKNYYEESTAFNVVVYPGKKVSLLVKGDGELSSGVAKKYFFGIQIKKGTWETIDKLTEYYELYEENL